MDDDVDAAGFIDAVDAMRQSFAPIADGATRAGQTIEAALTRAAKTGKLGFDDLKAGALSALDAIAAAAVKAGVSGVLGGAAGSGQAGTLAAALGTLIGGLPGRATGGPVTGARAYLVGEQGPELFVPTAAGQVQPMAGAGPRDVRVAITVSGPADTAPAMLRQSGRQVARAVKAALDQ